MLQLSRGRTLTIRFSSFGDIVQSSFTAEALEGPTDLVTKKVFASAFKEHFAFKKVYAYDKSSGLLGLWRLAGTLAQQNYKLVYDAHNNQRTLLFKTFLVLRSPKYFFRLKKRSKYRLRRFFLFKLRLDFFPKPFKGAESFLKPLKLKLKEKPVLLNSSNEILLAPSAAWDLKKWPGDYWAEVAKLFLNKGYKVTFLGGPQDNFIKNISKQSPGSQNLAGKLSWTETIVKIKEADYLISGDTGVLHVADYFALPATLLLGPSAFGRPSRKTTLIIDKNLKCQPCSKDGRGRCKNTIYKKCLVDIIPNEVFIKSLNHLESQK